MKRITFMLLTLVALLVAACSSNQTSSTGASPSASTASTAASTAAESQEASVEPEASGSQAAANPSLDLPDSAPELAALLPDEIGGQPATQISMSGAEMMAEGTADPSMVAFLEGLDAQPEDISVAFSFGLDPASGSSAGIIALRVEGANSDQLETEFRASMESEGDVVDWQSASVGGKDVLTAEDPNNEDGTMYLYTVGDIVFLVTSTDDASAAELLEPLP